MLRVTCVISFIYLGCTSVADERTRLVVTGFAGVDIGKGHWSTAGVIPATELALEKINNHSTILRDYELIIDWKDSRCSSRYTFKGLVEAITEPPDKIAFFGPGCSVAAIPVADAAIFWNFTQIGYSASAPNLYNIDEYPNFYIINPSDEVYRPAILALMQYFNWTKVFLVKHENSYSNSVTERLEKYLLAITKVKIVGFLDNVTSAVQRLQRYDARIMVFNMYENNARDFACASYHNGFYGSHLVWIVLGWYEPDWWQVPQDSCTIEQIKEVLINVVVVKQAEFGAKLPDEIAATTATQFQQTYKKMIRVRNSSLYQENSFASYAYDAVLALALVLNKTDEKLNTLNESLRNFTYKRSDITDIMKEEMKNIDFVGLTGRINLESRESRMVDVFIQQMIDYELKTVAKYHHLNNSINLTTDSNFYWPAGKVPVSSQAEIEVFLCVSQQLLYWTSAFSFIGILMALVFLWINLKSSNISHLKISSPPLNNFIILGCIISYLYVPVFGLKSCGLVQYYSYSCKLQGLFISVSFSLTFGTLFLKTWRVYRIFTNIKLTKQLRFLSNRHLVIALAVMILVDVIYILLWNTTEPLHDANELINVDNFLRSKTLYFALRCKSNHYHYWVYGLAGQKCLLLLFGIFLTWETRNVSFPGLNDSKSVAMCVYSICIFIIVVVPLQQFVKDAVNLHFGVVSGALIFCTTVTLLLLFVPKFLGNNRHATTPGSATNCPTISGNTNGGLSFNAQESTT